jgi:hypothetical protein
MLFNYNIIKFRNYDTLDYANKVLKSVFGRHSLGYYLNHFHVKVLKFI